MNIKKTNVNWIKYYYFWSLVSFKIKKMNLPYTVYVYGIIPLTSILHVRIHVFEVTHATHTHKSHLLSSFINLFSQKNKKVGKVANFRSQISMFSNRSY